MTIETSPPPSVRVARGASYLFAQGFIGNVSGIIFLAIATRILSVSEIGAISALGVIAATFVTMAPLAIPSAATKYISEYLGKGKKMTVKTIYRKTLQVGLLSSAMASLACFVFSGIISQLIMGNASLQPVIVVLSFDVFGLVLCSFLNGVLFGLQRFHLVAVAGVVISSLRLFASSYLLIVGFGLLGVVFGWVIGAVAGLGLSLVFVFSSFKMSNGSEGFSTKVLFGYSLPLYGSTVLAFLSTTIDRFIILFVSNLGVLAVYSIAIAAVNAIGILSSSIGSSLFPQFSQLHGRHGQKALDEASVKASRYIFLIYIPLTIGLASVARPTIELFFGSGYASAWLPLAIILGAVAVASASIVVNNILLSLGMTRTLFEANIMGVAVGAVLATLLTVPLGSVGAALGRATLLLTIFTYSAAKLKGKFGLHLDIAALKTTLLCSATMAVGVVLVQFVLDSMYMLPLYIAVGALIYIVMLRFTKFVNEQDIQLFRKILPERFHQLFDAAERFFL